MSQTLLPPEEEVKKNISKPVWVIVLGILPFLLLSLVMLYHGKNILKQEISSWTKDHRADCAVVLTGGSGRVNEGISLLAQARVKRLIISGVYPKANLIDIFPQLAFYGDIDEKNIILEKRSRTTYGNAQQSAVLIEALQCKDIVLITSNLHMYRALKSFEAVLPSEFPIYDRAVVAGSVNASFTEIFIESLKTVFYSLFAF